MVVKLLHGSLLGVIVATPLRGKCEDETHTPKSGNLESSKTSETSELDYLAWTIWTSTSQVMVERRAGIQTASLTPGHKKSRINPIPVFEDGVQHTVGKLLRKDTSLLQTSSQSEVWAGSYELPKSREFQPGQFRDSSLWVLGLKAIWMWVRRSNVENTIWGKVVGSLESGLWWVLWVQGCPWLVPTLRVFPKVN